MVRVHTLLSATILCCIAAQAVARASVRDRGEILESLEWTRTITPTD